MHNQNKVNCILDYVKKSLLNNQKFGVTKHVITKLLGNENRTYEAWALK